MSTNAKACAKRRDRLELAGLCIWCGKNSPDKPSKRCVDCKKQDKDRKLKDAQNHDSNQEPVNGGASRPRDPVSSGARSYEDEPGGCPIL